MQIAAHLAERAGFQPRFSNYLDTPLLNVEHAPYTIVIVGGGFCGTVLAANLLRRRHARATRIILVERSADIGRGVAYATRDYSYLLNVTANKMSANPRDPLEFLTFTRQRWPAADAEEYLPRAWYGEYLQALLQDAEQAAADHVTLTRLTATAQRITQHDTRSMQHVELDDGRSIIANDIVLALGNPPPAMLPGAPALPRGAYNDHPWTLSSRFDSRHSVLIVGTGLTMTDALLRLTEDEQCMPVIHAISRRGLLPLNQNAPAHHAVASNALADDDIVTKMHATLLRSASSTRHLLATARMLAQQHIAAGGDWRDFIACIRQAAPHLWHRLSLAERKRFLRHLQCYWDIYRHRIPDHVAQHVKYAQQADKLHVHAGRLLKLTAVDERVQVTWQPRGGAQNATLQVDAVINATGPDYDINRTRDPLLQQLRDDGLAVADPVGFGIKTATRGNLLDSTGQAHPHLFYLGPMLRAAHWESTAVTELSLHAEQLADMLMHERC